MNSLGVRIGYAAGTGIASVGQLREIARWAGGAGFDGLWVSQAFGVDPLVALAAVAGETAGLGELGTSVVPLVGRHPISLAAEVRTAQSALDGRLTLGLGASHAVVAEGVFGQSYEKAYSLTEEFLRALVPLLDGGAADVDGEQVRGTRGAFHRRCSVPGPARGARTADAGAGRPGDVGDDPRPVRAEDDREPDRAGHHQGRRAGGPPGTEDHGVGHRRRDR